MTHVDGGDETAHLAGHDGVDKPVATRAIVFTDLFSAASDGTLSWEPFRRGIEICRLYEQPAGAGAAFLRYTPGARLPRHQHLGYEHILILAGSQADDNGEHVAGAMLINPPGSSHAVATSQGCVVLAFWEKPVVFLPDEMSGVTEMADCCAPVATGPSGAIGRGFDS